MDEPQFVVCRINTEQYALDIKDVQEIVRVGRITRVPRSPECLRGVTNLRGRIITIVDMGMRLGLTRVTLTDLSRIIVIEHGDFTAGLLVDEVTEVIRISLTQMESQSALISEETGSLFTAVGKYEGKVLLMLDLASLLNINPKNLVEQGAGTK